jgi:hypothetical protein
MAGMYYFHTRENQSQGILLGYIGQFMIMFQIVT